MLSESVRKTGVSVITDTSSEDQLQGEDSVKFIKSQRVRRYGHVEQMEDTRMCKKIMTAKIQPTRRQGRRRLRLQDQVHINLTMMKVVEGIPAVKVSAIWGRVVEEVKPSRTVSPSD